MISIIQSSTITESVLILQKATKHIHQAWTCIQLKRMPTTHQRHCRNRLEWLRFHAAFQFFYRWHHSIYLVHSVFRVQIQIIPSECWFSMQWRHVWLFRNASQVTSLARGRDVKMLRPPFAEQNVQASVLWYVFSLSQADSHVPVQCQRDHCFAEGVECWDLTGMEEDDRKAVKSKVDHLALRPTCCLFNALIRFTSKWTWHFDTKEFHSRHVRSSPYCINMPLMFHSDTGL